MKLIFIHGKPKRPMGLMYIKMVLNNLYLLCQLHGPIGGVGEKPNTRFQSSQLECFKLCVMVARWVIGYESMRPTQT